ncbi:MAG: EAL domain-containing protein [Ideonella sp.]|nr:EAL domain-containing protein [Ideonella sp.]
MAPLRLSGRRVSLSCSIGVAHGPRDARTADELVRAADRAMLEAKAGGRNQVCALDIDGQQRLDRRGRLRRELGDALDRGRLRAAFSPRWICARVWWPAWSCWRAGTTPRWAASHRPSSFRWLKSRPDQRPGNLGTARRAARGACLALSGSAAGGQRGARGHQRLTGSTGDADLVQTLMDVVLAEGGDPRWIELEPTESVQLAEDASCLERLRQLRELGFHLALDDFRCRLLQLPPLGRLYFERLKIDQALCRRPARARTIGRHRLDHRHGPWPGAHRGGRRHRDAGAASPARAAGLDVIQGYLIARPMPLEALLVWRPAS